MTFPFVAPPAGTHSHRATGWFAIAVITLIWLELISRVRLEWGINPQYGYGWTVPFLSAFLFWRRWHSAPAATRPSAKLLAIVVIVVAALFLPPIRLIEEANPDWRMMSWAMAISVVA